MSLDEAAARTGGRWAKLDAVGTEIVGTLIAIDTDKVRTDPDGNVVLSKKSGQPRKVYGLLIQTDNREDGDDDGKRRYDANESAQYAIIDAFKEWRKTNPTGDVEGCQFWLKATEEAKDKFSQMGYKAKFGERVASALDLATVAAAIEEEPF
jgi:hypothetical protein